MRTASCQRCARDLRSCGLRYCTLGLLCLAALSIAPLSLCVRQSQCLCTPLRNGVPVGTLGIQLAHRISLQVDAVGAVHDAVADRIGDGGLADYLMPGRHR